MISFVQCLVWSHVQFLRLSLSKLSLVCRPFVDPIYCERRRRDTKFIIRWIPKHKCPIFFKIKTLERNTTSGVSESSINHCNLRYAQFILSSAFTETVYMGKRWWADERTWCSPHHLSTASAISY